MMSIDKKKKVLVNFYSDYAWTIKNSQLIWEDERHPPTLAKFNELHEKGLREEAIRSLRMECNRRIRTISGNEISTDRWAQKNCNFIEVLIRKDLFRKEDRDYAMLALDRKNKYISRYKEIRKRLDKMTANEINDFDVKSDLIWAGLPELTEGGFYEKI